MSFFMKNHQKTIARIIAALTYCFYFLLLIVLSIPPAYSQDCRKLYQDALIEYEKGDINEAIKKLVECSGSDDAIDELDKADKANVYWLLARARVLREEPELAKKHYREMLKYRPYFTPQDHELEDIHQIHQSIFVQPKLAIYIIGGLMQSRVNVRKSRDISIYGANSTIEKRYTQPSPRQQVGIGALLRLSKYIQVNAAIEQWIQMANYTVTVSSFERLSLVSSYTTFLENLHEQQLNYLSMPLSFRMLLPMVEGRVQLYVEGGGYASLLSSSLATILSRETELVETINAGGSLDQTIIDAVFVGSVADKAQFLPYSVGYIAGAGIQMLVKRRWHIYAGLRYQHGLVNITQQKNRYLNNSFLPYYSVMDDFSVNDLTVNLTWVFPISYQTYPLKPNFR